MANKSVMDLPIQSTLDTDDYFFTVVADTQGKPSKACMTSFNYIKNAISTWNSITNKPFDGIDTNYFSVVSGGSGQPNSLTIKSTVAENFHTHTNKTVIDKFSVDNNNKLLWNDSAIECTYTLPIANANTLGGVKIGSGININTNGVISVNSYSLPTASSSQLGGVKIGSGLTIDTNGILKADTTSLESRVSTLESTIGTLNDNLESVLNGGE